MSLTEKQRQHLEQRLRDERRRVLAELNRSTAEISDASDQERSGDLTKVPFHMADLGTDEMQDELDASNATRMSNELADIDDALTRLYHDPERFGICADTGQAIPFERLEIIPWAHTCDEAARPAHS
jgi:RNA polymerase-binding transcription factor DksA